MNPESNFLPDSKISIFTAAGKPPILPNYIVVNQFYFDEPTVSLKSKTNPNFDFGETFNSKLFQVMWKSVNPSNYSSDQLGNTFIVNGETLVNGKKYNISANIKVTSPVTISESNNSITFEKVQLTDNFWAPKQKTNAINSLNKAILEISKPSGGEPNFYNSIQKLKGEKYGQFNGFVFQDSDIYKSIEAISYTLSATQNDTDISIQNQREKLQEKLENWIEMIEKVQYGDGYIDTFFTLRSESHEGGCSPATHRFRDMSNHELYNAGHFLECVVAYTRYREGIKKPDYRLFEAGKRFADLIVRLFGPEGTRHEVPGHEEIELALVKFGKLCEEYEGQNSGEKYFLTAKTFIDRRGEDSTLRESGYYGDVYSQDKTRFVDETNAVGHSVRANYFYEGVTDIATILSEKVEDKSGLQLYLNSLQNIWKSVTFKKTYITGGIGTVTKNSSPEGFGADYDLPNDSSYCEICAAIAMANWNQRMNLLFEDAKYMDIVEKNLFNSILVGTNLEGNLFYYSTLLEVQNGNPRSEWFKCACCPPNLMRTIASLGGYMYSIHKNVLFVNMFAESKASIQINGINVDVLQATKYPWNGAVKIVINPIETIDFTLKIRVPGWLKEQKNKAFNVKLNEKVVSIDEVNGYISISKSWMLNDTVSIDFPMEIRLTEADPKVRPNIGRIAIQRGPIVYCAEMAGNKDINGHIECFSPLNFVIPRNANLVAEYKDELLKGVVEITGDVLYMKSDNELISAKIQAIPYFAWNNRGDDGVYGQNCASQMLIWIKTI